jgi:hypothetical protein
VVPVRRDRGIICVGGEIAGRYKLTRRRRRP